MVPGVLPAERGPGVKTSPPTDSSSEGAGSDVSEHQSVGSLEPVAVVELFTSEGCSSCPSADRVLARLEQRRRQNGSNVLTLAYHVDYWNRLGWRDRFSTRAYSDRQRWYAMRKPSPRVYTPQMIVQGTREFIGSHQDEARTAIESALAQPALVRIGLSAKLVGAEWNVRYRVTPVHKADHLSLALVRRKASTQVEAGENAGEQLNHVSVVVDYAKKRVETGKGSWRVPLPEQSGTSVVAYVQSDDDLRVVGANRLPLD